MRDEPQQSDEAPRLIFNWGLRERRGGWLFVGILLAIVSMVVVSMAFRVIRLAPRPSLKTARPILLLDVSSAYAQPLITRAAEQSYLLLGKRADDEASAALADYTPNFTPSYKGFDFTLKTLPQSQTATTLPRWFIPREPPFPPLENGKAAGGTAASVMTPEFVLRPIIQEPLSERQLLRSIKLSPPISHRAAQLTFRAAISSSGQVALALPVQSEAGIISDVERLRSSISRLRFAPRPGSGLEWGYISFAWQEKGKND